MLIISLFVLLDTAVQALYFRQNLARPSKPSTAGEAFLVWGGSTSVGMCE